VIGELEGGEREREDDGVSFNDSNAAEKIGKTHIDLGLFHQRFA
jgi:hypothetical protein